jgi:hypothetical protein
VAVVIVAVGWVIAMAGLLAFLSGAQLDAPEHDGRPMMIDAEEDAA